MPSPPFVFGLLSVCFCLFWCGVHSDPLLSFFAVFFFVRLFVLACRSCACAPLALYGLGFRVLVRACMPSFGSLFCCGSAIARIPADLRKYADRGSVPLTCLAVHQIFVRLRLHQLNPRRINLLALECKAPSQLPLNRVDPPIRYLNLLRQRPHVLNLSMHPRRNLVRRIEREGPQIDLVVDQFFGPIIRTRTSILVQIRKLRLLVAVHHRDFLVVGLRTEHELRQGH